MAERLVIVTDLAGSLFDRLFEAQRAGSDGDAVAVLQIPFRLWRAVNKYSVGAAPQLSVDHSTIYDGELTVF
jgi:hypothetical protein